MATKVLETEFELVATRHQNPETLEISQVNVKWLELLVDFPGTHSVESVCQKD